MQIRSVVSGLGAVVVLLGVSHFALSVSAAEGPHSPNGNAVPTQMHAVEVTDPSYGITAMTLRVPVGWKFAGTVARPTGCHANGPGLKFSVVSPDGLTGLSQMPGVQWNTTTSQSMQRIMYQAKCPPVEIQTASGYLVNIAIPSLRPGAIVTAALQMPPERQQQIAEKQEQMNQQVAQMAARYGQPASKVVLQGARIRIRYTQDGQAMEGQVQAVVQCTDSTMPGTMMERAASTRNCSVNSTTIAYAPRGQLEALLNSSFFAGLGKTAVSNPEWDRRISDDSRRQSQQNLASMQAASRAVMAKQDAAGQALMQQHNSDMQSQQSRYAQQNAEHDAQMSGYAKHNAAEAQRQDAVHGQAQQFIRYAGDKGLFQDPNTGQQVEASSMYNHQWMSGDGGTLIQTNDHGYDPNREGAGNQTWTELVPR
jgi:hypothetical protein